MKIKKFTFSILLFVIIISIFSNTYAANPVKLEVVKKASETKYLLEGQAFVSKQIVSSDPDNGEVTIELKVSNSSGESEEIAANEIVFVIDNSSSMGYIAADGKTRKAKTIESASKLAEDIFNVSSSVKMGLVDFCGGNPTLNAATVRQELTNNKTKYLESLQNELDRKVQFGTNIDAGLLVGKSLFSSAKNNKVLILLTDGVPTDDTQGNFSNEVSETHTLICQNTKKTLQDLKNSGIYTITLLTGMNMQEEISPGRPAFSNEEELKVNLDAAESIFGTSENPTADKYYLVSTTDLEKVITDDILKDVTEKILKTLKNIKLSDYFPDVIINNFNYTADGNPSKGEYSKEKDSSFDWTIDELKPGELATFRYKLKIKDMNNQELLDKIIDTNEKVTLAYEDDEEKSYTDEITTSPSVRLKEIVPESPSPSPSSSPSSQPKNESSSTTQPKGSQDNTVSKEPLPKTGVSAIVCAFIFSFSIISLFVYARTKKFDDFK